MLERAGTVLAGCEARAVLAGRGGGVPGLGTVEQREKLGFRTLDEDEPTPGLRAVREAERARGLLAELRVAIRRDVAPDRVRRARGR